MKRKTIAVSDLLDTVNKRLEMDSGLSQDAKAALCTLIGGVLHATGNYHGYGHHYWWSAEGYEKWVADGSKEEWPAKEKYISNDKKEEYSRFYYGSTNKPVVTPGNFERVMSRFI